MKKLNSILFIVILFSVHHALAQSISINHQFQDTTCFNLSQGGGKLAWVTSDALGFDSLPYSYHYMDSLQNIVDILDTNIINTHFTNMNYLGGQHVLACTMNNNGNLWGLFYDFDNAAQSFFQNNSECFGKSYFLYDFDSHQKHYLLMNKANCYLYPSPNNSFSINFSGDTILLSFHTQDYFNQMFISFRNYCAKWLNGNIVSEGDLPSYINPDHVYVDHNARLNQFYADYDWITDWIQTEGANNGIPVSYNQNLPLFTGVQRLWDAKVANGSSYILGMDTLGNYSILIRNNNNDSIISTPLNYDQYSRLCVDHANRIWIWQSDSIFMYDGNWIGFSMQGEIPFISGQQNGYAYKRNDGFLFEYAKNRFAVSFNSTDYYVKGGNGIIFINYNDPADPGLNHVQGKVFYDANNNGIFNNGETPMANQIINAGGSYTNTFNNGFYNIYMQFGPQSLTTSNVLPYLTSIPVAHNFNFITQTDTSGIDFAMQHTGPTNDLRVDMIAGIHRTILSNLYSVNYKNTGSAPSNGTISIQYDPLMNFASASISPTTNTSGNLTWDFTNLQPFESRQINLYLSANSNFAIGDTVYTQANVTPLVGDAIPADNTDSTMSIFVAAYDPNMKVVTQNGAEVNTILNDDPLEYVIHFQNVGNDTAFTVVITDTISNLLDLSSLEIIGSSHANYWGIYNRTLQFTFNGINLPDSGTNQLASNGFVSYRIKPVANISMGNVINNTAAIYFDVNAPVITNNAQVTLIDVTSIKEDDASLIKVVPNPAQQIIYILGKNNQNQTATIYDAVGKVVLRSAINNNQSIDISGLSKGIYFVEVAGQRVKFVKE
jgi:uncharacterized repeat protein (TIGR01451 family)